jgi:hypothetical protein
MSYFVKIGNSDYLTNEKAKLVGGDLSRAVEYPTASSASSALSSLRGATGSVHRVDSDLMSSARNCSHSHNNSSSNRRGHW